MDEYIKKWLDEGTISKKQAEKMLADVRAKPQKTVEKREDRSEEEPKSRLVAIIAIIGAVLIFVGFAWLIAKNWHQIPDILKVLILVGATLGAFYSGVMFREKHAGAGRALIALGGLLYILSLFLISQVYHLSTEPQHYAWLLFLSWTVVLATAYFLDSIENLMIAMLAFFPWVVLQYMVSVDNSPIFGFVAIFFSAGALLYGMNALHFSWEHRFAVVYRYWTVFYLLLMMYVLSFKLTLPMLAEYSFVGFSFFLWLFIILCLAGFVYGAFSIMGRMPGSSRQIAGFVVILCVMFMLVLATKLGEGKLGSCYPKSCYEFSQSDCASAPSPLICTWENNRCSNLNCNTFVSPDTCASAPAELGCTWVNERCGTTSGRSSIYQVCSPYNNQKAACLENDVCQWRPSTSWIYRSGSYPTSLWLLWIVNNIAFIGFIILVIWYGQQVKSEHIINLALFAFVVDIVSRYIGFWIDLRGYFAFSVLAILGGLMLIFGSIYIPKLRRKLLP